MYVYMYIYAHLRTPRRQLYSWGAAVTGTYGASWKSPAPTAFLRRFDCDCAALDRVIVLEGNRARSVCLLDEGDKSKPARLADILTLPMQYDNCRRDDTEPREVAAKVVVAPALRNPANEECGARLLRSALPPSGGLLASTMLLLLRRLANIVIHTCVVYTYTLYIHNYLYIYTCIYTYIYTHIYIYIYIYIYIDR